MTWSQKHKRFGSSIAAFAVLLLSGCGSEDAKPPIANSLSLTTAEDSSVSNELTATSADDEPVFFEVVAPPKNGKVEVDSSSGQFIYSPFQDFAGEDAFTFRARTKKAISEPKSVTIVMTPVNDPPVLHAIPAQSNSAETQVLRYQLPVSDVDGDQLEVTATADDPTIATVSTESNQTVVNILPLKRGQTRIHVTVRDSQFSASETFDFGIGDVTKWRHITADATAGDAISMTNISDDPVVFAIEHNGFPQFQSKEEIVEYVRAMDPQVPGEPFERKLWRFVRDNVYHNVPLNNDLWLYDTWATINAQGWGFCGHVSAVYVQLARAAGFEARVWGLSGHVIPEIKIGDSWQIYDPDLAIYYLTADGRIAGTAELVADPSLISAPVDPIFPNTPDALGYSQMIADFYGSAENNYIDQDNFLAQSEAQFQPVVLPPLATLTYPGRWTPEVSGVDGTVPYLLPHYLQAMMTVPSAFTGELVMPWMLWEVRGQGHVRIEDQTYEIGSEALRSYVQQSGRQIPRIEVLDAETPIQFIQFINAMRYGLKEVNRVNIRGKDVWAVDFSQETLPMEARTVDAVTYSGFAKPIP